MKTRLVWTAALLAGWMHTVMTAATPEVSVPRVEKHPAFASRHVAPREVDVWLPPGYDEGRRSYPVIYVHDGQNLFDPTTSFGGVPWALDRAMLRVIAGGRSSGAILVGIWNTPKRFAEYMPQRAAHGAVTFGIPGLPAVPEGSVQSDAYLAFIVSELKPFVDRAYRTQPDRAHTFVMGSSMGGLISLYAVTRHPEVFGGAACVSTHWPAGDGAVVDYLAAALPPPGRHRFYFDYGTQTLDAAYEPYQKKVDAIMRRAGYQDGVDWITRKFEGAEHSEKSWSQRADIPLAFLLSSAR